jgi:hypothetical protein
MDNKVRFNEEFFRLLINERGLSLRGFAEAMTKSGCPLKRETIYLWFNGTMPSTKKMLGMSQFFNIPIENFYCI